MKHRWFQSIFLLLLLTVFSLFNAFGQSKTSVTGLNVKVRGSQVQVAATVVSSSSGGTRGETMLILNGTAQNSNTFLPLAQSVVSGSGTRVSRVVLLDYPGHGASGFPTPGRGGLLYGSLTVDDYTTILIGALQQLKTLNMAPTMLLGHSLGAEVMMLAQNRLIATGTNLRKSFGIKSALFLVPDIPAPLQWAAIDAGGADGLATAFGRVDPNLGPVFDLATTPGGPDTWVFLWFGDFNGNIVPGAPTSAQALASGFVSIESGGMVGQLVGLPTTPGGPRAPRPPISPNIFSPNQGTTTIVIGLNQETLYLPQEHQAVYEFITGDTSDSLFIFGQNPLFVHDLHLLAPGVYNSIISFLSAVSQ